VEKLPLGKKKENMPDENDKPVPDNAADFQSHPEESTEKDRAVENDAEIKASFLSNFISESPFIGREFELTDEEKEAGAVRRVNENGQTEILFDKKTSDAHEETLITQFLARYDGAIATKRPGKEGIRGTMFEWFFSEPDAQGKDQLLSSEFFDALVIQLRERLNELKSGSETSKLGRLDFNDMLGSAAESFRKMAQREILADRWKSDVKRIPIIGIQGRKADGTVVDLNFDPNNIDRSSAAASDQTGVDFFLINGKDGQPELVITNKNPDFIAIRPVYEKPGDSQSNQHFSQVEGSYANEEDPNATADKDTSSFVIKVSKGGAPAEPLFTSIRVIKKPMDVDKELDAYSKQKQEETEQERQKQIAAAEKKRKELQEEEDRKKKAAEAASQPYTPPAYTPPAPSVPSTPRWNQSVTVSRSG